MRLTTASVVAPGLGRIQLLSLQYNSYYIFQIRGNYVLLRQVRGIVSQALYTAFDDEFGTDC